MKVWIGVRSSFGWIFLISLAHAWSYKIPDIRTPLWLRGSRGGAASINSRDETPPYMHGPEVVGAAGRMGSFFLCCAPIDNQTAIPVAVPRGVAPGCLSSPGSPIYVATPSSAWSQVHKQTLPERRVDLVLVGNGIPDHVFSECTIVVPHYAVLKICCRNDLNPIITSPLSPKTFVYGKHASSTAAILERYGVTTEIVDTFEEIRAAAARKLLWASCMWLMCHSGDNAPLTVAQVHDQRQPELDRLVDELLPALSEWTGVSENTFQHQEYLKAYSLSMPNAVPSKDLAIAEVRDRNGVWLDLRNEQSPQTFHQQLLKQVGAVEVLATAIGSKGKGPKGETQIAAIDDTATSGSNTRLELPEIGLSVWGRSNNQQRVPPVQNIVVIGGGIMGCSVALSLARRPGVKVAVVDMLSDSEAGETTPASWAWLNANGKEPKSYQLLNQLGLHAWKHHPELSSLPSWIGSLVRFEKPPAFVDEGGYPVEGPLAESKIHELEPLAHLPNVKIDGSIHDEAPVYFFPGEGSVDPIEAVKTLRRAAEGLGVQFLTNHNVTKVLRNLDGLVCGIESCPSNSDGVDTVTTTPTDLVVVAAGVGAAAKALGALPLLHRPGALAFAKPNGNVQGQLSRILVDQTRSTHVLQRSDGTIVAGGGVLEVGGSSGSALGNADDSPSNDVSFLDGARQLAPRIVQDATLTHTTQAVRPMPQDGLPAVGYLEQGLYTVVTHSGFTLGPLLGALAAGEIVENVSCDLLAQYRPTRFRQ